MGLVGNYLKIVFARASAFTIAQLPIPGVTTLKDTKVTFESSNTDGCLDWVFAKVVPHRTDGMHAFTYVKPLTTAERYTPVLTRDTTDKESWDAVLYENNFFEDTAFPLSASTFNESTGKFGQAKRNRIYTQSIYLDAITCVSDIKILVYISDKPFAKQWVTRPQPQPTRPNWNFGASQGDFGRCLHDDIEVPQQIISYETLFSGSGSSNVISGGALGAQLFYATNFKQRYPFEEINVELQDVIYVAVRKIKYPPPHQMPSEIAA